MVLELNCSKGQEEEESSINLNCSQCPWTLTFERAIMKRLQIELMCCKPVEEQNGNPDHPMARVTGRTGFPIPPGLRAEVSGLCYVPELSEAWESQDAQMEGLAQCTSPSSHLHVAQGQVQACKGACAW